MNDVLQVICLVLLAAVSVLQVVQLLRQPRLDLGPIQHGIDSLKDASERGERLVREEIGRSRDESALAARQSREELAGALRSVGDTLDQRLLTVSVGNDQKLDKVRETVEQRLQLIQTESAASSRQMREEVGGSLKAFNDSVVKGMAMMAEAQQKELESLAGQTAKLTEVNQQRFEALKAAVEEKLKSIQQDNAAQIEKMRLTVDEKLQGTLEKRLGESFRQVSERLEQVYKGLGEMQVLAAGVGDLKKVLTNVKTRGTWGEVQLGAMLEQILSPEQYASNVVTKEESREQVEFAIKLPGRSDDRTEVVWLPIDAKFPVEDYQRLVEAQEKSDVEASEAALRQLENRIKQCARDIHDKYLNPPATTDFGILFLPTEGLFAEVIRRSGLAESVQREHRVVIAGPTTLWSILNSLQMGFRTLAIEKRSSEVWNLLAAIKTEWTKYGEMLGKAQKKLQEASTSLDQAQVRTRAIGRKLRDVQELPTAQAQSLLMIEGGKDDTEEGTGFA
jgi:DNA recombination protein RmuC